jgi:hypothetical protein
VKPTDRVKLLHGPYRAPSLRVGDRATCLFRDCDVVVTSWTDAPLSWPRCRRAEGKGHPSLLVDEELARAIRTESAAAVGYWWGQRGRCVEMEEGAGRRADGQSRRATRPDGRTG